MKWLGWSCMLWWRIVDWGGAMRRGEVLPVRRLDMITRGQLSFQTPARLISATHSFFMSMILGMSMVLLPD
jgi:hypothetical protein